MADAAAQAVLAKNEPIDRLLHVVMTEFNPSGFSIRSELSKDFIRRMEQTPDVQLYVVELAYPGQDFQITDPSKPTHLQLRTTDVMWSKENLINIAAQKLLPSNWRAMEWIDSEVWFDDPHWAGNTLRMLNTFGITQVRAAIGCTESVGRVGEALE